MPKPRRRLELICFNPTCGKAFSRVAKDVLDPERSYCSHQCAPGRPPGNSPGVQIAYFTCDACGKLFVRRKKSITKGAKHVVCSNTCRDDIRRTRPKQIPCDACGKLFSPHTSNYKRTLYHYCSQTCTLQGPAQGNTRTLDPTNLVLLTGIAYAQEATKRRRARHKGAQRVDFTPEQWEMLKKLHKNRCVYCGEKCADLTRDHLTALADGGDHTLSNILPSCQSCNSRKQTGNVLKPVQPFLL